MDNRGGICLITFSNNADHQNVIYSMFRALQGKAEVYTIGIHNPKSTAAAFTPNNYYYNCPLRPGFGKGAFRFSVLLDMARMIRRNKIKYLYFESLHLWNAFLMFLCPQCIKIEAIHDVIPHDGNTAMAVCNFVTSKMADHVILRNYMYKDLLSQKYGISIKKITCFVPWREYPAEIPVTNSKRFLCFGRIRRYKGLNNLVEIVKKTPEILYHIVGEPDEESMELVEQLKSYDNVIMQAEEVTDEQMHQVFQKADWVVLPYAAATQSGVIVDACRLSRPVIAFNVGAIAEQIKDGETGFMVPEGDVDAFAQAVRKAAGMTEEETAAFAHQAYVMGYQKYSAEAVADKFLHVIYGLNKHKDDGSL